MNTHNLSSNKKPSMKLKRLALVFTTTLHILTALANGKDAVGQQPSFQRIQVLETKAYGFDFAGQRGPMTPALVTFQIVKAGEAAETVQFYYLFGVAQVSTKDVPLRWDVRGDTLFCTSKNLLPNTAPALLRYPVTALVTGPDWADALDRSKLGDPNDTSDGLPAPNYASLSPIGAVNRGIEGWEEGDALVKEGLHVLRSGVPVLHYDIRALDDARIELYMTVNGKLSRWLFERKMWTLQKYYTGEIEGKFLICDDGESIVAKRDGAWCLFGELEAKQPTIRRIVRSSLDEQLTLVEDKVTGINYFEYGGALHNENGVDVCPIPRDTDAASRLKAITEFVRSQREK